MSHDPITEEIRTIRRELAEKFGNDLDAILNDLREREAKSERPYAVLPRRPMTDGDRLALAFELAREPSARE